MKKKLLSALLAGSLLIGGGNALVESAEDGMMAFKEAYLSVPTDNRVFNSTADFFGPSFHAEMKTSDFILRDASARISGMINWEWTNPSDNQVTNENIPIYIEQNGEDMTMYVQRNGSWNRFLLPAIPTGIANAIKTTDINILQQNMAAVKAVDILQDNADQRIMNVTLDGKKLAELIHTYSDAKIAKLSQSEQAAQKDFINHISDALQTTDLVCAWTVDKKTWRTVTTNIDLTNLIRAYGKDYLDDAAKAELVLSQTDRAFYEALGYYSELHFTATYHGENLDSMPSMPAGAASARTNANAFSDLVQKIASTKR